MRENHDTPLEPERDHDFQELSKGRVDGLIAGACASLEQVWPGTSLRPARKILANGRASVIPLVATGTAAWGRAMNRRDLSAGDHRVRAEGSTK